MQKRSMFHFSTTQSIMLSFVCVIMIGSILLLMGILYHIWMRCLRQLHRPV